MLSRIHQLADIANAADSFTKPDVIATNKPNDMFVTLFAAMTVEAAITEIAKVSNDKAAVTPLLIPATVNELWMDFGATISKIEEIKPPPVENPSTTVANPNKFTEVQKILKDKGWDGKEAVSVVINGSLYVGGPHGEMYIQNIKTGNEELVTSGAPNATIVTRDKQTGDITGQTSQFKFLADPRKGLLTITASGEAVTLRRDGNGFDVLDSNGNKLTTLKNQHDIDRFGTLLKLITSGTFTLNQLKKYFDAGSDEELKALNDLSGPAINPSPALVLTLGDGSSSPTAVIIAADGTPMYYDFKCFGFYGLGQNDVIFSPGDTSLFGKPIDYFLANSNSGRTENGSSESPNEIITSVLNSVQDIALRFENTSTLDPAEALSILNTFDGVLCGLDTVAASYARSTISGVINQIMGAQSKLAQFPEKDNPNDRYDFIKGIDRGQ